MEPFAQRKAAADARRDSSDNMGDLVGCLSAWPATEAAPEVVDVARHAPRTAAARGRRGRAALEAAERARAWGQGPPETVIAQRRQHSTRARAAAKAALVQKPAVAERRVTLEGADGDTLHGVVAGTQSETALVLVPALGGTSDMAELCGIARRAAADGIASIRYDQRGTGQLVVHVIIARRRGPGLRSCCKMGARASEGKRVYVVGVSFGAAVAAAGRFDEVDGMVCISYPTDYLWFLTLPHAAGRWRGYASVTKPKLFVWGTRDQYAAKDAALKWYGTLAPPKDVVLFEGLDPKRGHVFHTVSLVAALSERVVAWVLKMA